MPTTAIAWFRRDLRVHDHPALTAALELADAVVPVFVLDDALLRGRWSSANRAWFLRESLVSLGEALRERGAGLRILHGRPAEVLPAFAREAGATHVVVTRDVSPYGRRRDRETAAALEGVGAAFHAKRGQYVHEPDEVLTKAGGPFTVYGPYRRAWAARERRPLLAAPRAIPSPRTHPDPVPDLGAPSADRSLLPEPGEPAARRRLDRWLDDGIRDYATTRDRMDLDGTSRLSQDLRWGLLSPLEVVERAEGAGEGRRTFVNELAWREFYGHVLWHHPRVLRSPFRDDLAAIPWRDDPEALAAWRDGRTGYPVVDAAMRQLRATGWMHNRARMVTASFLAKHLLLDWRLGEAEFMRHLTDGDPASNDGGWQWTAGTGTDPQPWFRVFNPVLQGRRHDPHGDYVRRWVPELAGIDGDAIHAPWTLAEEEQAAAGVRIGVGYPAPMVDHAAARTRALEAFGTARAALRGDDPDPGGDP